MRHIFIALFSIMTLSLAAQDEPMDFDYMDVEEFDSTVYRKDFSKESERKLQTGVDVTMGYMYSSAGYGGPQFSLSPHVAYPINKRFSFSAGMSVGYGNFYNPYYGMQGQDAMLPMTRMFLYVSGHYQVNEKLTVTGTAYTQINDVPNPSPDSNTPKRDFNAHGASIGFQYQLTPSISFGAQMNFEENGMYGPYSPVMNPYGRTSTGWW